MNRPFRTANPGGAALLAQGIHEGVNNFSQNFLDMRQQATYQQLVDLSGRRQAMNEGLIAGESAPVGATGPVQTMAPATLVGEYTGMGEMVPLPQSAPRPSSGRPAQHVIGADALATPRRGQTGGAEMSEDELRDAAFSSTLQARENALGNENDIDMLKRAYHYNTLMTASKPYLDTWTRALDDARRNPTDKSKWRGVMVLTGEDDPDKAFAAATQEYVKLRGQYDQYSQAYAPLGNQLQTRGITPDLYGDEAKFLQLLNQRQFQPHTPRRGAVPFTYGSFRPNRGRTFGGR